MVIPRVEITVKLITESKGLGTDNVAQTPEQRQFSENTEDTVLMTAYTLELQKDHPSGDLQRSLAISQSLKVPVEGMWLLRSSSKGDRILQKSFQEPSNVNSPSERKLEYLLKYH